MDVVTSRIHTGDKELHTLQFVEQILGAFI
jgi:hypothetical protein